ncbi:MAG: hypothetical protein ABIO70_03150 [Pseudomonadota bacterium]
MTTPTLYDQIPYPGGSFRHAQPDNLATLGALFGLRTVPVEACRVLELGCAQGRNLLQAAAVLPGRASWAWTPRRCRSPRVARPPLRWASTTWTCATAASWR